ncbi:tripartite motif-containing protein 16-like [Diretmus argenteus]
MYSSCWSSILENLKTTGSQQASPSAALVYAGPADVACDFCTGTRRNKAAMSCLTCMASYCEIHLQPHYSVPVLQKHKLVSATARLQEETCSSHDKLMEVYCRTDQQCVCLLCTLDEHKGHDTVSVAAERAEKQKQLGVSQQTVQKRVQERERELKELSQAVEDLKSSAQTAVQACDTIFTELIRSIERRLSEVKQLIRAQEKTAVSQAEELLLQLEEEIARLRRRDTELEELSHTDHHIHFIQILENLKTTGSQQASPSAALVYAGPADVACDFCTGTRRNKAAMSCLTCMASYCEIHLQPHYSVPVLQKHKLVSATARLQEETCSSHDKLMEVYCRTDQQCVCLLCTLDEHKGHDTVSVAAERAEKQSSAQTAVQACETIFTELIRSIERRLSEVKQLIRAQEKTAVSQAEELLLQLEEEIARLRRRDTELEELSHTDHHIHFIQNNHKVTVVPNEISYLDHPDRFTEYDQVLCREGLSGRCYWEFEWKGDELNAAVSYKDIRRTGEESVFGENDKSWSLECYQDCYSFRHNEVETEVSGPCSSRVGVYLDHEAGTLSFYSVSDTMTLLHKVCTTFTQPLYPGIALYGSGAFAELIKLW